MNIQKLLYQNLIWRGLFYVTNFTLYIIIARHFEAEFTGNLYYLVSIYALITLMASVSIESALAYFASCQKIPLSQLFNFSLIWVAAIAFAMVILFSAFSFYTDVKINSSAFLYALMFVCGNLLITFLSSLFYADNKFVVTNAAGIIINCLLILLLFFANENTWLNNQKYIFIYFISYLVQGLVLSLIFIINYKAELQSKLPSISQLKLLFKFCLLAFASNTVTFFYYRIDYWFIHHYRSPEELGNYIQVSKLAQMFFVVPGILAGAVFPLTAGGRRQEINNLLMVLSRSILFVYGIVCFILAITGKWLFLFVFGSSFSNMYVPFLFLIPGILGLSTLYTLTAYYAGKNRVIINLKGALLTLFVITVGDALFIPAYGINAAAAVSSAGYIVYHIYVLSIFAKEYQTPVLGFFIFKFSDISKVKRSISGNFND